MNADKKRPGRPPKHETKAVQFSIRLRPSIKESLDVLAAAYAVSVSSIVEAALQQAFARIPAERWEQFRNTEHGESALSRLLTEDQK